MSTTQTPDIDHAIRVLIHAKLPPLLEEEAKHIYNVLNSSAALNPATIDQIATAMADRLARLHRLSGCSALFDAARALGAKIAPGPLGGLMGAEIETAAPAPAEPAPAPKPAAPAEHGPEVAEPETLSRSNNWRKDLLRAVITADQEGELPIDLHVQMDGCGPSGEGADKLRIRVEEVSEIPDVLHLEVPRRMERDVEAKPAPAAPAAPDKAATEVQQ